MAQAERSLTTRRDFSKWIAAASVTAAIPAATQAKPQVSADLTRAAAALKSVFDEDTAAFDKLYQAEITWSAWNRDASEIHCSDERFWERPAREESAKKEIGIVEARAERKRTERRWSDAAIRFACLECNSMQDILFKAEAALNFDNDYSPIAHAVVYDLLKLHNVTI